MILTSSVRAACLLALITLVSASAASASPSQDPIRFGRGPQASRQVAAPVVSAPSDRSAGETVLGPTQQAWPIQLWPGAFPILVLPANKGFRRLQPALDFCASTPAIPATVLLAPGTYTGNFTFPSAGSTTLVGRDGVAATVIEGEIGVNQPVLRFSPVAGSTQSQASLRGLQVRGAQQAVVDYSGAGSSALLRLDDCVVDAQGNIPGIRMSGGGFDGDNRLGLELRSSTLQSQGDGIQASVVSYSWILCARSQIEVAGIAVEMQASGGSQGTELLLWDGAATGQNALRASDLDHLWCGAFFLSGPQVVADLSGVADALIERSELYSQHSDVIRVSSTSLRLGYLQVSGDEGNPAVYGLRVLNSSSAQVAYCGFSVAGTSAISNNAIDVDGGSTATAIFSHWRYFPLP